MRSVTARYEAERMPSRASTARVYRSFLKNHVLPKWVDTRIQDVYGDVVTDEMSTAGIKVAELAFQRNGAQAEQEGI